MKEFRSFALKAGMTNEQGRSMTDSYSQTSLTWERQQAAAMQHMHGRGRAPGLARNEQVAGKSGREILEAMMSGELPYPPMNETMNMTLLEVGNGRAVFQGIPLLQHYNPLGTLNGGWFATLLVSALGCAVQRAAERRVGKVGVGTCRARGSRSPKTKKIR